MKQGKVKFFNNAKGFGFITPSDGGADVFVHESGLVDKIKDNDQVEFETERGPKGINAVRVQVVRQ
jgi:CspA family cold shock protein